MLQKVILTLILMKSLGVTCRQMQKDAEQFFHMVLFTFVRGSYNLLVCQSLRLSIHIKPTISNYIFLSRFYNAAQGGSDRLSLKMTR